MLTQENKDYLRTILKRKLHKHKANIKIYEDSMSVRPDLSLREFKLIDKKHIAEIESILSNMEDSIDIDIYHYQKNAEEDYLKVPISVLKYITKLEKLLGITSELNSTESED